MQVLDDEAAGAGRHGGAAVTGRRLIGGRYELEDLPLARGGMGEVWLGRDITLEREVAVKFVRHLDGPDDQELVRRFFRESRITARLVHPGVPAVYDAGTDEQRPYLVMQRVHGVSVTDLIAEHGPLPVGWAAAIAAQVASVLTVAHRASLIHRDFKPANLMLEPDGTVKVLDFGLAVALDRTDLPRITATGAHLGSPAYMAPEQVLAGASTPATDMYALGATLFEMLTGQRLFAGASSYTVMQRQVEQIPTRVRSLRADAPAALDDLVAAMLRKAPEERPASAEQVYAALIGCVPTLEPIPGVVDDAPDNPVRMYAAVAARVQPWDRPAAPLPEPRAAVGVVDPAGVVDRAGLRRARDEARALARKSRHSQAADLLAAALRRAGEETGSDSADVLALRFERADILFEGGDFHRAVDAFHALVADLTRRDGAADERVLRCRLREATCHALLGAIGHALDQLHDLLADEVRLFGVEDPRVFELRRQIGVLQLGAGDRTAAVGTLDELASDLVQAFGPQHPMVPTVRDLLARAQGPT
ncbi:serine/threonine-protein kinase [Frankia gtarii]|uniref:serine/threonine-protein kinase n=1 Tax=Frankia gtarii TaxID=2950102 RepID=UPI0021BF642C|nr:serine/threonine-protein kinase [Frankia gtarii]